MDADRLLALSVLPLAVGLVVVSAIPRYLQYSTAREIQSKQSEVAQVKAEIDELGKNLGKTEVHMERRVVGQVPQLDCSFDGFVPRCEQRFQEITADVPVAVSGEDPQVRAEIDAREKRLETLKKDIDEIAAQLGRASPSSSTAEKDFVRAALSLIVCGAALHVVLARKYPADTKKWAFGALGTLLGFWFG